MSKIYVNGLPVKPEEFASIQNDPSIILVTIAPLKFQAHQKSEISRNPNLANHLADLGVIARQAEPEISQGLVDVSPRVITATIEDVAGSTQN